MRNDEKLCCDVCRGAFPSEEIEQVGLLLLCPLCKDEADTLQSMQAIMTGGCRDYQ